jgi:methyl-accepting chemotaxis protein
MGRKTEKSVENSTGQKALSKKITAEVCKVIRKGLLIVSCLALVASGVLEALYSNEKVDKVSKVYTAEINRAMQSKASMIEAVAAGISSGSLDDEADVRAYVDSMVETDDQVSAVYSCYNDNTVIMSGGWEPEADFIVTERDWYIEAQKQPDKVYISEPYVDKQSGGVCITLAKTTYKNGEMIGAVGMDMYVDDLISMIEGSYSGSNYVFLATQEGTILTHPSSQYAMTVDGTTALSEANHGRYVSMTKKAGKIQLLLDYKGGIKFGVATVSDVTGWTVITMQSVSNMVLFLAVLLLLNILIYMATMEAARKSADGKVSVLFHPLESISNKVTKVADGDLSVVFDEDKNSVEIANLTDSLTETIDSLSYYIGTISDIVAAISDKDLTVTINGEFKGSYMQIKEALESILASLNHSFSQIKAESGNVLGYVSELERTTENVAVSATEQNLSIVEVSDDMGNLAQETKRIIDSASRVKETAKITSGHLENGTREMDSVINAMNSIAQCYGQIADFVVEIQDIATQTNLLSLNATIEAARAGEAGKGFAIVANEISALADSSAKASENISTLIEESQRAVEEGKELVNATAATIEGGRKDSLKSEEYIKEIATFVENQQTAIKRINDNLKEIAQMVETNAASAQENTAISHELEKCAKKLMGTAESFLLTE